jgi:hypothetical protein
VRNVEELGSADGRQVTKREAAPFLFLPGRPGGLVEALEGGEAVLERPAGLATPNTEPLDRCAVERQWRRGDGGETQPIAPSICSWMSRFISIA